MQDIYQLFSETHNLDVKGAVKRFRKEIEKIFRLSESDTVRSAAFYASFKRLVDEFCCSISEKEFPVLSEKGLWGYEVEFDYISIELVLVKYVDVRERDDDGSETIRFFLMDSYNLYSVESKLLSVEEYAEHYDVDPRTVTQWIRRGKIRVAQKIGNIWLIPELADRPTRGYSPAMYELEEDVRPLIDQYPFLKGVDHLRIEQSEENRKIFLISCYRANDGTVESMYPLAVHKVEQKEKEKFELALITHPKVRYIANFAETMLPDYIRATSAK